MCVDLCCYMDLPIPTRTRRLFSRVSRVLGRGGRERYAKKKTRRAVWKHCLWSRVEYVALSCGVCRLVGFGRRVVVGWGQNRNAWLAVFQREGAPECIGLVGGSVGRCGRSLGGLVGG